MRYYNIGAIAKIIVGTLILLLVYNLIKPTQDPEIAISFSFLGIFIAVWGISFYMFFGFTKLFSSKPNKQIASYSYKLSLLFGLYVLFNIILLLSGSWNKGWGIASVATFIILQILLTPSQRKEIDDRF